MSSSSSQHDENVRSAAEMFSKMLAASIAQNNCPIHEDCDGSCTGEPSEYQELVKDNWMYEAMSEAQPKVQARILEPGTVCRDATWFANQRPGPFAYTLIDSTKAEFRLLRLKPANYKEDVIECDMIDTCLDEVAHFAALSYHWGAPAFDHQVLCNGKLMAITSNLHDALKRHRQDYHPQKEGLLWVDALCINQSDREERNGQVMLMHRIYSEAATVYIDLGHADRAWLQGYDLLIKLGAVQGMEERRARLHPGAPRTTDQLFEVYKLPSPEDDVWHAYFQIFSAPWFSRAWVVQEFVLAASATVRYGPFKFQWNALSSSFPVLSRLGMMVRMAYNVQAGKGLLNVNKLQNLAHAQREGSKTTSMLEAMIRTRDFQASDPRDKIIAILGLVNEQPQDHLQPFRADYALSVETLYHRFAIHMAEGGFATQMLNLAGLQRTALKSRPLPTWVPDWTADSPGSRDVRFGMTDNMTYHASGSSVQHHEFSTSASSSEKKILIMIGNTVDKIMHATNPLTLTNGNASINQDAQTRAFLKWHDEIKTLIAAAKVIDQLEHSYEDVTEALARTLIANDVHSSTAQEALTRTSPITEPKLTYLISMICFAALAEYIGSLTLSLMNSRRLSPVNTYQAQALPACGGRRFVVTEKGYMGLAPHCAQVGDSIAVVLGAPVPYVLRPSDVKECESGKETMLLVGDAYVHGIMDGEAMGFEEFAPQEIYLS